MWNNATGKYNPTSKKNAGCNTLERPANWLIRSIKSVECMRSTSTQLRMRGIGWGRGRGLQTFMDEKVVGGRGRGGRLRSGAPSAVLDGLRGNRCVRAESDSCCCSFRLGRGKLSSSHGIFQSIWPTDNLS